MAVSSSFSKTVIKLNPHSPWHTSWKALNCSEPAASFPTHSLTSTESSHESKMLKYNQSFFYYISARFWTMNCTENPEIRARRWMKKLENQNHNSDAEWWSEHRLVGWIVVFDPSSYELHYKLRKLPSYSLNLQTRGNFPSQWWSPHFRNPGERKHIGSCGCHSGATQKQYQWDHGNLRPLLSSSHTFWRYLQPHLSALTSAWYQDLGVVTRTQQWEW